ncbi:MAG: hypothetical protein ACYCUC_12820 [Candidatus Dormibacteria bacterium]
MDPPFGLRFDAKSIGGVAIVGSLFLIGLQMSLLWFVSPLVAVIGSGGTFNHEILELAMAVLLGVLGALLGLWGGWRMWRGQSSGKVWIVAGLGLGVLSCIGSAVALVSWQEILQSCCGVGLLLVAYCVVVMSRFADASIGEVDSG